MHNAPINILIVDDHPILRTGLRGLLETVVNFRVVAEAGSAMEAARHVKESEIDIVLMDIRLGAKNGFDLTEQLLGINSSIKVIMFTDIDEEESVLRAKQAGASGYMVKTTEANEIKKTINNVYKGQEVFPLIDLCNHYKKLLTLKERQVFWLLGDERLNNDLIAIQLNVGIHRVQDLRSDIRQALKPTLSEAASKNPDIMIIKAVKYNMRCKYPTDKT
jgi:DNA-binding NarL/FixJ family response regulator